eukprot:203226_1
MLCRNHIIITYTTQTVHKPTPSQSQQFHQNQPKNTTKSIGNRYKNYKMDLQFIIIKNRNIILNHILSHTKCPKNQPITIHQNLQAFSSSLQMMISSTESGSDTATATMDDGTGAI